jgi:hypothetical protein
MTREEQISNGFTEMMKGFWGNQDLKVPEFEVPCKQEPCEDWYDVPSDEMTLGQARQAVKDLRKRLAECLWKEPRKDEVILTKEEYGELVSSEFDNGYAKGYTEALEQNDVLDKIRAEIEQLTITEGGDDYVRKMAELFSLKMKVLHIIDKYKAESEEV